jgi:hypothetical protein
MIFSDKGVFGKLQIGRSRYIRHSSLALCSLAKSSQFTSRPKTKTVPSLLLNKSSKRSWSQTRIPLRREYSAYFHTLRRLLQKVMDIRPVTKTIPDLRPQKEPDTNKKCDWKWIAAAISTAIMATISAVNDGNLFQKWQKKSLSDACYGQSRCFFRTLLYVQDLANYLVCKKILGDIASLE